MGNGYSKLDLATPKLRLLTHSNPGVVPEIEEKQQERLRYVIAVESKNTGEIVMYWEKLEISVPFEVVE